MAQITYDDKSFLNQNPDIADVNKCNDTDLNEIKSVVNTNTPPGIIQMYAGTTIPTGWLNCDGSAVSRTTYANLFSVIGTIYGSGDGSTTFNLPNLEGKVVVGYNSMDTSFNTVGKTGGEKTHTLTIQEMPSHNHTFNYSISGSQALSGDHGAYLLAGSDNSTIANNGSSQAHNNLQPYITLNYIISF